MGIRIHKYLGYGLVDVKTIEGKIVDDRFNLLGYLLSEDRDYDEIWNIEGFSIYYKNFAEHPFIYLPTFKKWNLYDSVIQNTEYGIKNVFMIVPPGHNDWKRVDDIIDYTEENRTKKGPINRFEVYDCGIWPYQSSYIDLRTGEKENRLAQEFWFHYRSRQQERKIKTRKMHWDLCSNYASRLGFKTVSEATENLIPEVPEIVQLLCKYLCLFNDDETILHLKPMMYIYWG